MALKSLPLRWPWRRRSQALHVLEPAAHRSQQILPPTRIFWDHQVCKVGFHMALEIHQAGVDGGSGGVVWNGIFRERTVMAEGARKL
jgi:hypothetical protein